MGNLITLERNKLCINPVLLSIKEFKYIWQRDKTPEKVNALNDISYIYYKADYKSEYIKDGANIDVVLAEDIYEDPSWCCDEHLKSAVMKYKELQKSPSILTLESIRKALNSVVQYFNDVSIKDDDSPTVIKRKQENMDPGEILTNLKKIEPCFEMLDKLDKRVYQELVENNMSIMGGGEIGIFEEPEEYIKNYHNKK